MSVNRGLVEEGHMSTRNIAEDSDKRATTAQPDPNARYRDSNGAESEVSAG
jgi:hypothetical protein